MRYRVFTDGAYNQNTGYVAYAFLILTTATFIAKGCYRTEGDWVEQAEEYAVYAALRCLFREVNLQPDDTVIFYVDNWSVIKFFEEARKPGTQAPSGHWRVQKAWRMLQRLTGVCDWRFQWCKAHKKVINGNAVVDRLAKYALRVKAR